VVEAKLDVFDDEEGAERDLDAYRDELEATVREIGEAGRSLPAPELGEEAVLVTATQGRRPRAVRFYAVAWRQANTTSSLVVNGFEGRLSVEDA
jgi:hypothetical protein